MIETDQKNILIRTAIIFVLVGIFIGIIIAVSLDSNKNGNDERRKNDIEVLAQAIMEYRNKGPLPASSGNWCDLKQDGTGCPGFPSLISEYINFIPKDPEGGYYKYYSDSKNFFLMSNMSDTISTYTYSSSSGSFSLQKKNFLTINQSNGSENQTLNGFDPYNSARLASDENVFYEGRRAVKVEVDSNNSGVFIDSPIHNIPKKKAISIQAMVWVPLGKTVSFGIRGDNENGMLEYSSKEVNGNNNWQMIELNYELTQDWKEIGIVVHSASYNVDPNFYFFIDSLKLEYGNKSSVWVIGS
ncbi:hypothetical protein M0R01_04160 [bacterium]|nr:hypothetical protein [bacterium]